jgi:hypothetical protein
MGKLQNKDNAKYYNLALPIEIQKVILPVISRITTNSSYPKLVENAVKLAFYLIKQDMLNYLDAQQKAIDYCENIL